MQRRPRPASNEKALPDLPRPFLPWLSDPVSVSTTADADAESESSGTASTAASTSSPSTTATSSPSTTATSHPRARSRTRTTRPDTFALDDLMASSHASHEVTVANQSTTRQEFHVLVTGSAHRDVRHADSHAVAPDAERVLLDTADLDPDGVETFHVTVETDADAVDCRLRTNQCAGDLRVDLRDDGSLGATRRIN